MAVSKDLYKLIQSMDKAEKSFFIKDTFKGLKDNMYLKMYQIIEKQSNYDEDILIKKMSKFKGFSSISSSKNYLYKVLLNSMMKLRDEKDSFFIIRKKISEIEVLFEKGLSKKCLSKIAKAIEYCKTNELLEYELILQRFKLTLLHTTKKRNELSLEAYNDCEKLLTNRNQFYNKACIIKTYLNELGHFSDKDAKIFQELKKYIEDEPLFSDEKNALTYSSKILFYNFNAMLADLNNDLNKSYLISKKQVALLEKEIDKALLRPKSIVATYCNHISLCSSTEKFDDMINTINKSKNLEKKYKVFKTSRLRARVFECVASYELIYYLNLLDISKCEELIPQYKTTFRELESFMINSNKHYFNSVVSTVYFYKGDYLKALETSQELLYAEKEEINDSLMISAFMMCIIAYFEEEMFSLMKSSIRSLKHFLMKIERFGDEDHLLFKFFNLLLKTPKNEHKEVFKQLLENMSALKEEKENFKTYYFDIFSWVESKAINKDILVLLNKNESVFV